MSDRIPTAAIVRPEGPPRSLVSSREPDEEVTEEQLTEQGYAVRLFMRVLREIAALRRRFVPSRIDFEDRAVGVGTYERFPHGFGGRVRWWVVDKAGDEPELIRVEPDTLSDKNTLVLYSGVATTVTVRVEEAG